MKNLVMIFSFLFFFVAAVSQAAAPQRVSGTTTLTNCDSVVLTSGAGYDVTLPACSSGTNDGVICTAKNGAVSGVVTFIPTSGDTFEGGATGFAIGQTQADAWMCDGANDRWLGLSFW